MDRRPIASRGSKIAVKVAKFLADKNISPNFVSIMSVVFALFSMISFMKADGHKWALFCAALFIQLRLICNLLDGMIAVEHNKKSIYGNLYNDIPDRFADVFIIMGAAYFPNTIENGQHAMTLGWINSILAVMTAYLRVLGVTVGTPMFFAGLMAKPQRMALLTISSIVCFFSTETLKVMSITLTLMLIGQILTIAKRLKLISSALKSEIN